MVLLTFAPLRAQELPLVHYGVREGLPSAFVNALALGAEGEIWIAGSSGVVRYDGVAFTSWRVADGLLEDSPNDIAVDGEGRVWILFADKGIQWLDTRGR
ncbi:MAG: hypothetical protein MUE60_15955, partial [Candidatus Eisenbacteria bacterium]|nr:hypothetical protein [Candidatus Eisenbacteria bacterium]